MAATRSLPLTSRNAALRLTVVGGLIISIVDAIIYHWLVSNLLGGFPLIAVYQYIASGLLGDAAFQGGIATALLGVFLHFLISFIVAGVFFLGAERLPIVRRHPIIGSLLYGIGVFIVMNFIVTPLSATPAMPPPTAAQAIIAILDHMLVIGLPLGILLRRNAATAVPG